MKLHEIVKLPTQPRAGFQLKHFDTEHAKQLTTAENIPVFHCVGIDDPNTHIYMMKVDDQFVAVLIGQWGHIDNKPALYIERTATLPQYRRKGLMTALYVALHKKLKYILVSDFEQSPESIKIWQNLAKIYDVKVIDTKTMQKLDYNEVPVGKIFGNTEHIRLMMETKIINSSWIDIPEPSYEILDDYLHYTHEQNLGLYE